MTSAEKKKVGILREVKENFFNKLWKPSENWFWMTHARSSRLNNFSSFFFLQKTKKSLPPFLFSSTKKENVIKKKRIIEIIINQNLRDVKKGRGGERKKKSRTGNRKREDADPLNFPWVFPLLNRTIIGTWKLIWNQITNGPVNSSLIMQ